jgi:predicted anti-sigma-YlaC factor YlaD
MSADVEHVTCRELVEVLTDYLENALEPAERADIERHLVICRGCANYVEQMHSTLHLLGRIAADDPPEAQSERLLAMFREWQAGRA